MNFPSDALPPSYSQGYFPASERSEGVDVGRDGLHSGRVLLPLFAALIARRAKAAVIYGTLLPCKNFGRRRLFSLGRQAATVIVGYSLAS